MRLEASQYTVIINQLKTHFETKVSMDNGFSNRGGLFSKEVFICKGYNVAFNRKTIIY